MKKRLSTRDSSILFVFFPQKPTGLIPNNKQSTMFLTACLYLWSTPAPCAPVSGLSVPSGPKSTTMPNKTFHLKDVAHKACLWNARKQVVADRNRHTDRMERSFCLLSSTVLSRKERQARCTFSTGVVPALHDQALYFEIRRNRQTMRTSVFPGMVVEGGDRSHQRFFHAKNLALLQREGGARSLHRMRSRHALLVDLPMALEEKERRLACRHAFQGVLSTIREKVEEKQRMQALLLLAGRHERVMASVRVYRNHSRATRTNTVKATGRMETTETMENQDQAIFFLLVFFLASFWVVVMVLFTAVFFLCQDFCQQVAIKTKMVVTDFMKETERVLSIMEKKHDVSTSSRCIRRAKERQEKKRSKRFMTHHYVFLKH